MAFDGCCPDCKRPGDDCPLTCNHAFHLHCILKWVQQPVGECVCRGSWVSQMVPSNGPQCIGDEMMRVMIRFRPNGGTMNHQGNTISSFSM
ncbi:hypothetical protein N665_0385s0060 [Sinapis alba]|nr:hypothetical protein N665_0385s0060 [Sinapis alba]